MHLRNRHTIMYKSHMRDIVTEYKHDDACSRLYNNDNVAGDRFKYNIIAFAMQVLLTKSKVKNRTQPFL